MSPKTPKTEVAPQSSREAEKFLTDLHYAIFRELPDEGRTQHMSPLVVSTRFLASRLNEQGAEVTTSFLGSELRSLRGLGFVHKVQHPGGRTLGWQKTSRSAELLREREGGESQ